jgi:hypothetical protein
VYYPTSPSHALKSQTTSHSFSNKLRGKLCNKKSTSKALSALLGPDGVKLKNAFKLEPLIECHNDSGLKSCIKALACVVAKLRTKGFVLSMRCDRLDCECNDEYWEHGDFEELHDVDCGRVVDVLDGLMMHSSHA